MNHSASSFTWSAEVGGCAVHSDSALLTGAPQRRLVPHAVIDTTRRGLDSDPARTKVKVQVDVTVQKFECEEIRLQQKYTCS
jgi:hypothetical protein